jgi:hypothetical protein
MVSQVMIIKELREKRANQKKELTYYSVKYHRVEGRCLSKHQELINKP